MKSGDIYECFRLANSETQKEPLTLVNVPALTWYRSFLIPARCGSGARGRYSKAEMKRKIDECILVFMRNVKLTYAYPSLDNHLVLFDKCVDVLGVTEVEPPSERHRNIFHGDERTVILGMEWRDKQSRYFDVTVRAQLRANVFNLTIIAHPRDPNIVCLERGLKFQQWNQSFWARFVASMKQKMNFVGDFNAKHFSLVFADIRGVLVSVPTQGENDWAGGAIPSVSELVFSEPEQELTASYLLNGKALSLSTVGSRALRLSDQVNIPITFLLLFPSKPSAEQKTDPTEIGRLVENIHLVAMFRLGALLDLRLLRKASDRLSQIDALSKKALEDVDRFELKTKEAVETRESLRALRNEMNAISNDFLTANKGGVGLSFRIESSRYYVSQLGKNISNLGLKAVPNFVRYDEFVSRKLGITFEFIDRLGTRYERALNDMSSIEQSFASIQARHTGETLADIQRDGELILLAVLVPYYLMGAILHVLNIKENHTPRAIRITFATLWVWFIIGSLTKWAYTKYGLKRFFVKWAVALLVLIVAAGATVVVTLALP